MTASGSARPFYVTGCDGQIRLWQCGEGADLAVLSGLTRAAETIAVALAAACPGRRVTVLELPGVGGSSDHAASEPAALAGAVREALALVGLEWPTVVACDLAGALLDDLADVSPERLWLGRDRALAWARTRIAPPDLAPRTDGTHLVALWSFLRDRHVLKPDDPTQPAPDGDPIPEPADLDAALVAAAVRPERYAALWGRLAGRLGAAPPTARGVSLRELPTALAPSAPEPVASAPPPAPTSPLPRDLVWHQEVETARGRMHLRRIGGEGRPLLIIPTGGGSSAQFEPVLRGLSAGRQTFAVDYLGNGLSENPDRPDVTIDDLGEDMAALLDALGFEEVDVWGSHTGAVVGLELALRHPHRVGRLVMEGPVFVSPDFQTDLLARYFPPIEPDTWGRHLPLAWNWRRDMFLFWPWYRVARAAARTLGLPSAQHLHDYAIGILESGRTYDSAYRAAFSYDTRARLPGLTRPALVTAGPNDMLVNALAETRALDLPLVTVRETPTTVWWPDPDPAAAKATLAIYDDFLRGAQDR